jgi:hypothetical protein
LTHKPLTGYVKEDAQDAHAGAEKGMALVGRGSKPTTDPASGPNERLWRERQADFDDDEDMPF